MAEYTINAIALPNGDICNIAGQSEIYYVNFTRSGSTFVCNKTYTEVAAALVASKTVLGLAYANVDDIVVYSTISLRACKINDTIRFPFIGGSGSSETDFSIFVLNPDDSLTFITSTKFLTNESATMTSDYEVEDNYDLTTKSYVDTSVSAKEDTGKITIDSTAYTASKHTITIEDSDGTTTTINVVGVN